MKYTHRKFLVTVNRVEENGVLNTISGDIPVSKGEVVLTDDYGDSIAITEKRFNEYYVPVEQIKEETKVGKDFSDADWANAYADMADVYKTLDDYDNENYINDELVRNKAL